MVLTFDAIFLTAMSSSIHVTPYKIPIKDAGGSFENLIKFSNGYLAHPELLLLSIELLGLKEHGETANIENMENIRGVLIFSNS